MTSRITQRMLTATAAAAATILILAGCSAGNEEPATPDSSAPAVTTDYLAEAYEGVTGEVPTEAVEITDDIHAWIVSCGQAVTTCSSPSNGAAEAAAEIGWQADICDGKLNPMSKSECIRSGIAAGADVIIVVGDDCAQVSGALAEAKSAGITTIGAGGNDCDGDPLFSGVTQNMPDMSNQEWWTLMGELQAKWLVGKTDGNAKLLNVEFNDTVWGPWMNEGRLAVIEDCENCEIVATVQLANSDVATGALAQKLSTALLQAPDANALAIPIDGWFLAGLGQAIEESGRSADLNVIGAFGSVPNFGLIRDGVGEDATVAFSPEWNGWGAIDTTLRVLAGQDVIGDGTGLQVVDAETNLPAPGASFVYTPEIDFRSAYRAAWGL